MNFALKRAVRGIGFGILGAVLVCVGEVSAQPYDIVVTPLNRPVRYDDAGFNTTVITSDQWEKSGATSIRDVLNQVSFINVVTTAGVTGVFFRGSDSSHTLVMLDGVSLSDPSSTSGEANIDAISLAMIDRIEIVSGGNSVYNGSSSMAGSINFVTKKNSNSFHHEQSDAAAKSSLFVSAEDDVLRFQVGVAMDHDDRVSSKRNVELENDSSRKSYMARIDLLALPVDLSLGGTQSDADISYDFSTTQFVRYQQSTEFIQLSKAIYPTWYSQLRLNQQSISRQYDGYSFSSLSRDIQWINTVSLPNGFGVDTQLSTQTVENQDLVTQVQNAALVSLESFNPWVNVRGAKRFFSVNSESYESESLTLFRSFDAASLTVKLNFSSNYRVPSLYEQSNNNGVVLRPERSFTRDVSIEKSWESGTLGVTYFETDVPDRIEWDAPSEFYYNQTGLYKVKGLEWTLDQSFDYLDQLSLSLTTHTQRDTSEGAALRIPVYKAGISAQHSVGSCDFGLLYLVVGEQADYGDQMNGAYSILNGRFGYSFSHGWTGHIRLENILNRQYDVPFGYPQPSRTVFVGIGRVF